MTTPKNTCEHQEPRHESLWTVDDVAQYLRVSKSQVYQSAERGKLPCTRLGDSNSRRRALRFEPAAIRAWAMRHAQPAGVHSSEPEESA
ncbi:MAG: helix-turn-helix domain-containing protein [Deltaproteobacteria bacterium]|nr:helix-turn-helix domain-containing protein [Deltaproteobacteria bacterium]